MAECGRLAAIDVEQECSTIHRLSVAAFCRYKMLIGAIRGEIWSLFNTGRRISEIARRGGGEGWGWGGGGEIETELRDRNIGECIGTDLTSCRCCSVAESYNEIERAKRLEG
jgi:hypothetical protein